MLAVVYVTQDNHTHPLKDKCSELGLYSISIDDYLPSSIVLNSLENKHYHQATYEAFKDNYDVDLKAGVEVLLVQDDDPFMDFKLFQE